MIPEYNFTGLSVISDSDISEQAAELFREEIFLRTGVQPGKYTGTGAFVKLSEDSSVENSDSYFIAFDGDGLVISARGIRGLIYGYSMFLRKTVYSSDGKITLIKDISGSYSPLMKIRGHQIGYRPCPNTYDAWDITDYKRYYRDMMFFGTNMCEHIPTEPNHPDGNRLMKFTGDEMAVIAAAEADRFDLDVSLWYPNEDGVSIQESTARRKALFEKMPRLNVVFPPGGDPGDYQADEFIARAKATSSVLKEQHPNAEMWPSAQQPHSKPDWGEMFINEMEKLPDEIDGVITGPNRAFPLDTLRRRLPEKYPIRLYPDITHNVRCEYPVHFDRDDWHFAIAAGLGRESINPRPLEYRLIHRLTRRYIVGSVSYSEGVSDDINKMVWGDMDYFGDIPVRETLADYSRVFFPGVDYSTVADGILALEQNWYGDPAENPSIEHTLSVFEALYAKKPELRENWRFVSLLFRASCDALIRRRRLFELSLLEMAEREIRAGDIESAKEILERESPEDYLLLREKLEVYAKLLFDEIGIQLDVERYGAESWERGATLDTIDNPVTDRLWLKNRLSEISGKPPEEQKRLALMCIERNRVERDEFFFSVALNGLAETGIDRQDGEIYINFMGDNPSRNNGSMPMSMLKVYDNLSFRLQTGGFSADTDYVLQINYLNKKYDVLEHHKISVNGHTVYEGKQFGGEPDEDFDRMLSAPGFVSAKYIIPKEYFVNGCALFEFSEPHMGVMFSEFSVKKIKSREEIK